jgi:hypothetical protein
LRKSCNTSEGSCNVHSRCSIYRDRRDELLAYLARRTADPERRADHAHAAAKSLAGLVDVYARRPIDECEAAT